MAPWNLEEQAIQLEAKVEQADALERLKLQPKISRIIATLTARGESIPSQLRRIDRFLTDEADEARFDNMPV